MLNADRVWARISRYPQFQGRSLDQFRYIGIGQQFSLTSGAVSATTRVDFPAGSIILGIACGVSASSAWASTRRQRDAIRVSIDYPHSEGIITGGRMNGEAIFGSGERCEFPPKEIIIPRDGSLNYVVENLTTTTINVDILHHCLVDRAGAK